MNRVRRANFTVSDQLVSPAGKASPQARRICTVAGGATAILNQESFFQNLNSGTWTIRSFTTPSAKSFPPASMMDETTKSFRHPGIPFRRRHRLLAQRKKFQDQGRLPASRRRRVWARRCRRLSGNERLAASKITRRECHPHRARSARARVSRSVRSHGLSGHGRNVRLLDGGQEPATTITSISTNGRRRTTRHRDARPQSPQHHSLQRRQRDPRHAATPDWRKRFSRGLVQVSHETDPTRPVTQALFRPNASHDYDDGLADLLDVIGQNYRENEILAAHEQKPSRKIIGTENQHDRAAWLALRDNPPYAGQFLWSGIDYLGESRRWPVTPPRRACWTAPARRNRWLRAPELVVGQAHGLSSPAGSRRDAAGPTDPGYEPAQQDALRRPQVLFARLDAKKSAAARGKCGGLFQLQGSRTVPERQIARGETVMPTPRRACGKCPSRRARSGPLPGTTAGRWRLTNCGTAGQPAKIVLTANHDRLPFDWNDVAFVRATVVDRHDIPVPGADDLIAFKVSGPGMVAAVDSANNASHEPFQADERHAFHGRCVVFVRAGAPSGKIVVTASAPGLESGSITLKALPPVAAQ